MREAEASPWLLQECERCLWLLLTFGGHADSRDAAREVCASRATIPPVSDGAVKVFACPKWPQRGERKQRGRDAASGRDLVIYRGRA